MRGRELPATEANGQEDAQLYMQDCYLYEGEDRRNEPAVLVRASAPGNRDVFHSDDCCGLIAGEGRHPEQASWMLLGDARAVGYEPCTRCGTSVWPPAPNARSGHAGQ